MQDQAETHNQQERLTIYRRTLAHWLQQAAQHGGEAFAPPQVISGIHEARTNIRHLKQILRAARVIVLDYPDDEPPDQSVPLVQARQISDTAGRDKTSGRSMHHTGVQPRAPGDDDTSPKASYSSCFISYSHHDEAFAQHLASRLRAAHLRVWFAPEDVQGGEKLSDQIGQAIQIHDRLLLVLSEHSMQSEWVMTEIRRTRRAELREQRRKLFPIRLVDMDTIRSWECFDADIGKDLAVEVREYFIPDFSNWQNHDDFETAFARLLRDLRAAEMHE